MSGDIVGRGREGSWGCGTRRVSAQEYRDKARVKRIIRLESFSK